MESFRLRFKHIVGQPKAGQRYLKLSNLNKWLSSSVGQAAAIWWYPSDDQKLSRSSIAIAKEPLSADRTTAKVIRDGFSIPVEDYGLIAQIQELMIRAGISLTKSSVVRAALHALAAMRADKQVKLFRMMRQVKTGRPRRQRLSTFHKSGIRRLVGGSG